jgi:lantibiotic biosynthesis protein
MILNKKNWKPIIDEDILKARLTIIADTLEKTVSQSENSLMVGNTGVALFLYYYWLYTKDDKYLEKGNALILEILNLNRHPFYQQHSLCNGSAGFMWAIDHLISNGFIEGDCNELFSEKEPSLNTLMENDIKEGKYDFLHNALGVALYFLNRRNPRSITYIESLILELERTAEKDIHGLKWKSYENLKSRTKEQYNTGLSHGIASIIAFLGKVNENGILKNKTKDLIYEAVSFLLSLKSDNPNINNESFFPSVVLPNNTGNDHNSRLAWCYGDLGIGIVLWQVAKISQNEEWENMAINLILQTGSRRDPKKTSVIDAGICHGSAGIAHIYNRMYQHTGIEAFKDYAIYWLNDILNKAVFTDGLAGYKAFHPEKEDNNWIQQLGMLEGIAGIGLVLLSSITDIEPKWDECLLLS